MQSRSIEVDGSVPRAETLLARAETFRATTLESGAFTWEFTDRSPNVTALREAARLGMTGMEVDLDLGGLGLGFREKVRVAEILSRSSLGFTFSLVNTQNVAARLAVRGTDRHRRDYLPDLLSGRRFGSTALTEPDAGSDFSAITTSAVRTDGGWVLNGEKAWITNATIADVVLCYAQTDPDRGRDGIACFVVDGRRRGFNATDAYRLVAGSTIGVAGFSLDHYEASEDDMIIGPGEGFRQALSGVNGARIYVAAMACAAVRAALGHAVDYGSTRESFGRPLLDHQGLAWSLAEVANRLEAAEALTARAVDRYDEAQQASDDGDAARVSALAAAHAKKFATEMVEPALRACMQAMGAQGLRAEHTVGRLLAESRILAYVDGTTEMQTDRIGRSLRRFYGSDAAGSSSVAGAERAAETASVIDLAVDEGADPVDENADPVDENAAESYMSDLEPTGEIPVVEAPDGHDPAEAPVAPAAESEWSDDHFSPLTSRGFFPDLESASDESAGAGTPAGAVAAADSALPDATQTIEFEQTGEIAPAGAHFGYEGATAFEPTAPPPPPPPMDGEPEAHEEFRLPTTPPMPPAASAEPTGGFSPPPPPPPPTGPPLSTAPPLPSDAMRTEHSDEAAGSSPPLPPAEFQQVSDPVQAAPPLPGDEHRIEPDPPESPPSPPLPPDSMRRVD